MSDCTWVWVSRAGCKCIYLSEWITWLVLCRLKVGVNKRDLWWRSLTKGIWRICGQPMVDWMVRNWAQEDRENTLFSKILWQCSWSKFWNGSRESVTKQSQSHVVSQKCPCIKIVTETERIGERIAQGQNKALLIEVMSWWMSVLAEMCMEIKW